MARRAPRRHRWALISTLLAGGLAVGIAGAPAGAGPILEPPPDDPSTTTTIVDTTTTAPTVAETSTTTSTSVVETTTTTAVATPTTRRPVETVPPPTTTTLPPTTRFTLPGSLESTTTTVSTFEPVGRFSSPAWVIWLFVLSVAGTVAVVGVRWWRTRPDRS